MVKLEKLSGPLLLSWGSDALKEQHLLLASLHGQPRAGMQLSDPTAIEISCHCHQI